jgi:hypothetical protein
MEETEVEDGDDERGGRDRDGMIGKEDMLGWRDEAVYLFSRQVGRLMASGDGGSDAEPGQMTSDPVEGSI